MENLDVSGRNVAFHSFGQTEVQNFYVAVGSDFYVSGFQIAVNDAAIVSSFERFRDFSREGQRFVNGNSAASDAIGQRRAFDQLHHQGADAV